MRKKPGLRGRWQWPLLIMQHYHLPASGMLCAFLNAGWGWCWLMCKLGGGCGYGRVRWCVRVRVSPSLLCSVYEDSRPPARHRASCMQNRRCAFQLPTTTKKKQRTITTDRPSASASDLRAPRTKQKQEEEKQQRPAHLHLALALARGLALALGLMASGQR